MARPLLFLPPLVFAAIAAGFFLGMRREDPDALPSAIAGQVAPAVSLEPLGDRPVFDGAALKTPGVKLVNYWASWCAPCRAEHPNLELLAAEGIPIYGINYKDDPAKAEAFLERTRRPLHGDRRGRVGPHGDQLGSLWRARDLRDRRRGQGGAPLRRADHAALARGADPPGDRGGLGLTSPRPRASTMDARGKFLDILDVSVWLSRLVRIQAVPGAKGGADDHHA